MRSDNRSTLRYAMDYILDVSEETESQVVRDVLREALDKIEVAQTLISKEASIRKKKKAA